MLSSDILEEQFGPTELIVVFQDTRHRLIQTVTHANKTVLEVSLVTFDRRNTHLFADVQHTIMNGESMGKAFRQAGIDFYRSVNSIYHTAIPITIRNQFNRDGDVTIVDVDILVGPDKLHYCHIVEVYSPSVVWPTDAVAPSSHTPDLALLSHLLEHSLPKD